MIEESEAYALLKKHVRPVSRFADVPIHECLGHVAAADVVSQFPMPMFANAMVDGYALTSGAHEAGESFRVIGEQAAGIDQGLSLALGETARIFTGAPLPQGTDSVIMQEVVKVLDKGTIQIEEAIGAGKGLRQQGDDLLAGQKILSTGEALTPQRLALLASQGHSTVNVRPHPRVHVFSTGDELRPLGEELAPGQLYESNALMMCLSGTAQGWPGWTRAHVADDPEELKQAIAEAAASNDFLFLSGGVSVGDHDHVRSVLDSLGLREHFWRVRVQPGKPVLFGTLGDCHVLGLPGNPVSSFVSFHLFGVPAIQHWLGVPASPREKAILNRPVSNDGNRPHYLRGHFDPETRTFGSVGLQKSHGMLGLSKANAIARIPPMTQSDEGSEVEILRV
jgi:molybdopterin molybdotransferase